MALDIIKEQRMIRTLFYSLLQSAELIADNEELSSSFVSNIEKFIRDRTIIEEGTRDIKEIATEFIDALGWRNTSINFDSTKGSGKIILGRNRYFVKELSDTPGTLLVIQAIFQGIGYHLFTAPTVAAAKLTFSTGSYYEINLQKLHEMDSETEAATTKTPNLSISETIHEGLTIDDMFNPIFQKSLPDVFLFEAAWKVITESYVANFSDANEEIKEALKKQSMTNLSKIINKITENEDEAEIMNLSELVGEFIVKILSSKINEPLITKLQTTLQDRHSESYLIYYECRKFCAGKKFVNRCTFIRSMWVGILSEIFGVQMKIKELFHAGKRDRYCMLELTPDKK